jgi:hypothetical protein
MHHFTRCPTAQKTPLQAARLNASDPANDTIAVQFQ